MQTIAKITPADYPDLLAAVDAGTTQRELARRYDCVPSLIARHVARARRSREPGEPRDPGSMHPRSEDIGPRPRLPLECARETRSRGPARPFPFPPGTLFVQPSGPEGRYQILARKRGVFERLAHGSAWEVVYLIACLLGLVYTEEEARAILAERDASG